MTIESGIRIRGIGNDVSARRGANLYFFCSDFALLVKDSLEHLVRLGFGKRLVRRELRDDPMHLLSYRLAVAVPIVVFLPATEKQIATGCVASLNSLWNNLQ